MSFMHIPQETLVRLYYDGEVGKADRDRAIRYLNAGILSMDLEKLADVKAAIARFHKVTEFNTSTNNTVGQYLGSVSNTLGKIFAKWEQPPAGVTPEQHEKLQKALRSPDACKKLKDDYVAESKRLRKPRQEVRENGDSAPREKHHDWEDIVEKEKNHTGNMMEYLLNAEVPPKRVTEIRNAVMLAATTRMENTRAAWATVKVRNFDPQVDNYILFSEEAYGDSVVVWNDRKGGGGNNHKRYIQTVPKDLADLVYRYACELHSNQDFLFPIDVKGVYMSGEKKGQSKPPKEILKDRQKQFADAIRDLTKKLLGTSIGESDMRRIQITHMGLPDTHADLERLAVRFHHSADEHRKYFRKAHKRPATEETDEPADEPAGRLQAHESSKKQRTDGEGVADAE
ncbi:hypothetical protein HDV00_009891 [Rhizophlyctis rosea]|nr:hypothetical protein HDV00_009891 [Rhizophlyctis rosea]